ncbi:hypothetical protein [Kutzneria albida]|uniref:Uncharacterized protein n=1 Tax=Kutzneria albida DSM 43870 TaxID=1449976 RepID=W5WAV8_9PSEU|nr:hypothetical protein [Kutzneria albida]AHH97900.1 hypothetical protein KALB_4538 [Kutzneria albida DSM 43870]
MAVGGELERGPGNAEYSDPAVAIHQHTDRGSVPGFGGLIDRDATVLGVAALGALFALAQV